MENEDEIIDQFFCYEDYLDSQITPTISKFLSDKKMIRNLISNGIFGDVLSQKEFEIRKKNKKNKLKTKKETQKKQDQIETNLDKNPLLSYLFEKEKFVRKKEISILLFIQYKNPKTNEEISGIIDFFQRLNTENFEDYYLGKKILIPNQNDISYFEFETKKLNIGIPSKYSSFKTIINIEDQNENFLLFQNIFDQKIIDLGFNLNFEKENDPKKDQTEKIIRNSLDDSIYSIIFEHKIRK
ncbi:cilia- and flagella-associated protein [Anaeramoeba ignava]|uniref:Cilia- and flagella-associated protein 299 n=1 Tax=Anaeramoeba ignava TaxID=1746090 RepID=A0A9Q0LX02_ANAIG|nr:cilia- and flagella-associated protein [Anaeramoeba ignava]